MEDQQRTAAEAAPLLAPRAENTVENFRRHDGTKRILSPLRSHISQWFALYACAVLIVILDGSSFMTEAAKLRMLEVGLCREYYAANNPELVRDGGGIPEYLCKQRQIQSSLAKMRGLLAMLDAIPGLILAVPYGMLADKKGQRLVLGFCLLGLIMRDLWVFTSLFFHQLFPTKAVYAASAMLVIGGGSTVLTSMVFAIVAASIPEELRTQAFFWVQFAVLTSEFLAPPLGSLLMEALGPHLTFLAGVPLELIGFLIILIIPGNAAINSGNTPLESSNTPSVTHSVEAGESLGNKLKRVPYRLILYVRQDIISITSRRPFLIGLLALVVAKMARPLIELTLQFMSIKFDWPIRKTSFLLSAQAAGQIFLFAFILPVANRWLLQRKWRPAGANLCLARASAFFLGVGALFMGVSPNAPAFISAMIIYVTGGGYSSALKSLLTSLIPQDQISLLFTVINVFEGVAVMLASPILHMSFSWGIHTGGMLISLPFYIAACLYGMAAIALSFSRLHNLGSDSS